MPSQTYQRYFACAEAVAVAGPAPGVREHQLGPVRPGREHTLCAPEELYVVVGRAARSRPAEHRVGRGPRRVRRLAERQDLGERDRRDRLRGIPRLVVSLERVDVLEALSGSWCRRSSRRVPLNTVACALFPRADRRTSTVSDGLVEAQRRTRSRRGSLPRPCSGPEPSRRSAGRRRSLRCSRPCPGRRRRQPRSRCPGHCRSSGSTTRSPTPVGPGERHGDRVVVPAVRVRGPLAAWRW